MNITPISMNRTFGNTPKAEADKKVIQEKEFCKSVGLKEPSPAVLGLTSGVFWFLFSFGMDKLLGKMFPKFLKSDNKLSLAVNGAFGVGMGLFTYFKARKDN